MELIKKKNSSDPVLLQAETNKIDLLLEELLLINNRSTRICFETIKTILCNILKFNEEKYRKLNKSNTNFHNKLGIYPHAIQLLREVGFVDQEEFLILQREDHEIIEDLTKKIDEILMNVCVPEFDPCKSSIISNNKDVPKIISRENDPISITQEIQRLNSQEFPKIDREPRIFPANLDTVQGSYQQVYGEIDYERDDDVSQLANIQSVMRQREEFSKFRSKRKNELSKLKETRIVKAVIRIKFPDKTILQGSFSVKETANDLYIFVAENLYQKTREFFLYEVPLKRVIKNGKHNLQPFAPASLIYFAWSDLEETTEANGPFLSNI